MRSEPSAGAYAGLPGVSVCFPACNEVATIGTVIEEAHDLVSQAGLDFELIVCDDGSTDGTGAAIDALAARLPRLRVIHHPTNLGIRDTFEHLYSVASKEFVFLNSVDRQWDTRVLLDMLPLTRDWDVVIAARRRKPYGPLRRLVSWGFNVIPLLLFGVRTMDAGAVKLQRREIIERFPLVSRSPFTEVERIVRATRAGYRYALLPVDTAARATGRAQGAKWTNIRDGLLDIPRVWWALNITKSRARHCQQRAAPGDPVV